MKLPEDVESKKEKAPAGSRDKADQLKKYADLYRPVDKSGHEKVSC